MLNDRMSDIKITRRFLKEDEINLLIKDIRLYPDLVFVKESDLENIITPT